jgi:hypothetical protein
LRETVEVPLQLWDKPRWELRGGNVDPADVFRALRCLAAEATSLFLEGTSIADDVRRFLEHHREAGPYVPARQTIWPATERFRVPATAEVLEGLAELAESHAQPEIADHLFLYRDREAIVEYPDAFYEDCPLLLAGHLARETVERLSAELSLRAVDLRGLTSDRHESQRS